MDGSGNMYMADYNNNRIHKIVVATGMVAITPDSGTL